MASVALLSWLDGLRGRWSAAGRQVALDGLISPLRYDILVRAEFFRFHREHAALYDHSLPDYLAAAQSHPYFLWFTEVYVRRFHPELAGNPRALLDAFADRVRRSVELFRSFEARGFDSRHPIVLRSGRTILPTETGKVVSATVFAGNGCHRLALLLARGVRWLEPGTYVVKRTPTFRPLDNTALLLPVLRLSEAEYCDFIARRYASPGPRTRHDLLRQVGDLNPAEHEEVRALLEIDQRHLADSQPCP